MNEEIKRLNEERGRLHEQMTELLDAASAAKRSLTAEEAARYDQLEREYDAKTAERNRLARAEQRTEQVQTVRRDVRLLPGGDRVVTETDDRAAAEEYERVFVRYLRHGIHDLDQEQRAVLRTGFRRDNDQQRAMSVGTAANGGYTVPTGFYDRLVEHLIQSGAMRQTRVTVLTTDMGNALQIPKTTAHGSAAWIAEAGTVTASDETLGQTTLNAYKAGRSIKLSSELVQDTGVDLLGYLAREFGRSIGALENAAYVVGDGSSKPTGLSTVSTLGKTGASGQTTTVIGDDLTDLFYAVTAPYRRNAEWMMDDAMIKVIRKLKDANDQYLWQPGLTSGEPDMLLGKPVHSDPDMPDPAASAKSILFGDFSAYFIRDVGQLTIRRSDEIYIATDEIGFFGLHRTDGKLIDLTGAVKHYAHPAS